MRSSRHNQRWPRPRDGPSHRLAITVPCCAHFREGPVLAILAMLALKDALCVAPGGSAPLFPFRSAPWPPMFQAGTGKRCLNRTRKPARHDRSHALTTQKGTSWRCGNRGQFWRCVDTGRYGGTLGHYRSISHGPLRLDLWHPSGPVSPVGREPHACDRSRRGADPVARQPPRWRGPELASTTRRDGS